MAIERQRELRRRRHRKLKIAHWRRRAAKATASEKLTIAEKLRKLSPGAEQIVAELELDKR